MWNANLKTILKLLSDYLSWLIIISSVSYDYFPALVLNGRLLFWEGSSHPPVSSRNLPFWDYSGLNVRSLWIFQVDHIFYKLNEKIVAASNEIRCMRCSRLPSLSWPVDPCQRKHELCWHKWKKRQESVWESIQFVILKPWKMLCNWIDYH